MNWTPDGDDPNNYRWGISPAPILSPGAFDAGAQQGHGVWLQSNFMLPGQNNLSNQVFPPPESSNVSVCFMCACAVIEVDSNS